MPLLRSPSPLLPVSELLRLESTSDDVSVGVLEISGATGGGVVSIGVVSIGAGGVMSTGAGGVMSTGAGGVMSTGAGGGGVVSTGAGGAAHYTRKK
jgi:hypothetical protein